MHRQKVGATSENSKSDRLYSNASGEAEIKLVKPFKCPSAAAPTRDRAQPARKKRKVNYNEGGDGKRSKDNEAYIEEGGREPLGIEILISSLCLRLKIWKLCFGRNLRFHLLIRMWGTYI